MGLGSTTKKLQVMAERAEQLYAQVNELRDQITDVRETVDDTGKRVEKIDRRSEHQWEIIKALAEANDIDVDAVITAAAIEDIEGEDATEAAQDDADTAEDAPQSSR